MFQDLPIYIVTLYIVARVLWYSVWQQYTPRVGIPVKTRSSVMRETRPPPTSACPAVSPLLLLVYHVPKTGGSSFLQWLHNQLLNAEPESRPVDFIAGYTAAPKFVDSHFLKLVDMRPERRNGGPKRLNCTDVQPRTRKGSRIPTGVRPITTNECVKARDVDYEPRGGLQWAVSQRIALEFHSPSLAPFLKHVLPRMHLLKAAFEQQCGSAIALTLVREPVSFVFSFYHMWPPRIDPRTRAHSCGRTLVSMAPCIVEPFPDSYMQRTRELQSVYFALRRDATRNPDHDLHLQRRGAQMTTAEQALGRCGAVEGPLGALETLKLFDVVGRTDRLAQLVRSLQQMRATASTLDFVPNVRKQTVWSFGPSKEHYHQAQRWTWAQINASTQDELRTITACDAKLYEAASARGPEEDQLAAAWASARTRRAQLHSKAKGQGRPLLSEPAG